MPALLPIPVVVGTAQGRDSPPTKPQRSLSLTRSNSSITTAKTAPCLDNSWGSCFSISPRNRSFEKGLVAPQRCESSDNDGLSPCSIQISCSSNVDDGDDTCNKNDERLPQQLRLSNHNKPQLKTPRVADKVLAMMIQLDEPLSQLPGDSCELTVSSKTEKDY
jgi:hypothetical protein